MSEIQQQAISNETTASGEVTSQTQTNSTEASIINSQPVADNVNTAEVQESPNESISNLSALLSEEFKSHKSLGNFKDVNDLAKSYLHAQQMLGRRVQDLSQEDVAVLNQLRGVPDSSDKYSLPDNVVPEETAKWYKDIALQAGLTQEQAKKVFEAHVEYEKQVHEKSIAQRNEFRNQALNSLKKEFGQGFDQQFKLAQSAAKTFGGREILELLDKTGLGDHPNVIKMFAKIGENLLEDSIMESNKNDIIGLTPERARQQIDLKLKDREFSRAYNSSLHPNHKKAVEEMTRLFAALT